MRVVTPDDVYAAAERVAGAVLRTPLLPAPWADPGRPLWLKPESLQPVGAFKLRGAYNALARLSEVERARGVVTHSSGNHAQALARAARDFGIRADIVMPEGTPQVKIDSTRAHGAEVVLVSLEQRESAAAEIVERSGAVLVPPYDHPDVIAGQGTVGLEIAQEAPHVGLVLVPVGGGGLAAGVGTAVRALCPRATVLGVEPELAADARESLLTGAIREWSAHSRGRTIADGLRSRLSELTFAHLREVVDGVVTVTEDEIRAAMATAVTRARLVAEPSGAVTLAAYLNRGTELPTVPTVAVVSGGNVAASLLSEVLTACSG